METHTKLTILGYVLLAIAWTIWFGIGALGNHWHLQFWVSMPIQVCALVSFVLSIGWRIRKDRQNRPPQDDGEPRQQ